MGEMNNSEARYYEQTLLRKMVKLLEYNKVELIYE